MTTLGPALIGATISTVLYGVTSAQVIRYYTTYDDGKAMRYFIGFVWLMDTLQQCLVAHVLWWYLIARCYGDSKVCAEVVWYASTFCVLIFTDLTSSVIMAGVSISWLYHLQELCAFIVECFFIFRIWRFREEKNTFLLVVPAALGPLFSTIYLVDCIRSRGFFAFETGIGVAEALTCLSAFFYILTDVAIATTMSYCLYKSQEGGLRVSKWLIGVILKYTVATGLLSCIIQAVYMLTVVASWATGSGKYIYIGIYFVTAKTYVNCMLASLNSRQSLRERLEKECLREVYTI